jgi:type II secretory pathway component PulL
MSTIRLVFAAPGEGAWSQIAASGPGKRDLMVLVLPGEDVLGREAAIPGSTLRQAQAAAQQVLADDLGATDGSVAAVGAPGRTTRLACIIDRTRLLHWQSAARARGLKPDRIVADYCLLSRTEQADILRVAEAGDRAIARASDSGFATQRDLLSLIASGRHIERVDLEQEAASSIRSGRILAEPDLASALPPETDADGDRRTFTRIAIAAGLALVLVMAAPWIQVLRLGMAASATREAAAATARAALPQASRIVNARAQLEEALIPLGGSDPGLNASGALLAGLSAAPNVQIVRLTSGNGEAQAQLSAAQDADLAPLRDHLAAQGVTVTEAASQGDDGRITIELRLRAAQ